MISILFIIWLISACSGGGGGGETIINEKETDPPQVRLCENQIQDGGETGIDCGGTCSPCFYGTTYYVSREGDDDLDGLSPETAWATISNVNDQAFLPGDAVLFRKGDTWREELVISWSGAPGQHITFGSYGSGKKPQILGSEQASNWVSVAGADHVWKSDTQLDAPYNGKPASVFFGETDGSVTWGKVQGYNTVNTCGSDFTNLQGEYDWCYDSGIYIYSEQSPDSAYRFVEVPQRRNSITMVYGDPDEYITIDGLDLQFGIRAGYNDGWPMDSEVRGLTIKNCHIGYIGIRGGDSAHGLVIWHSDMLVQNNDIHDCGRRSISYNVYTDNGRHHENLVFENVIFENNVLHNGYHTTGFDISHGDNLFDTFRNFTFRYNFIYDDTEDNPADGVNDFTSMSLYLEPGAGLFTEFDIHHNVIKNPKQKGLAIGGVHNLDIYNNVIYGMNPNIGSYRPMVSISGDFENVTFVNNIIYGTLESDLFMVRGVYIGGNPAEITHMDHNVYFQEDPDQPIVYVSSENYQMNEWLDYMTDTGLDQNSPKPQNPLFVDPENNDFRLRQGSCAIDAGFDKGFGFEGNAPDIGAFEYSD